jgi:hypothetical protein
MPLVFSAEDLDVMARVRNAIEPSGQLNPGKILPSSASGHGLAQRGAMPTLVPEGMWV